MQIEVDLVAAGVNPQRLGDGSLLMDRVVKEATKYLLFSYPYIRHAKGHFTKNLHHLRDKYGAKIVIDSGGFELAEGTATGIDPVDVINVQNSLASLGFILDFPPDHLPFDQCLEMTADHVKKASVVEKKFDYYLVIHGRNLAQMEVWYNKLKDLDSYHGASVSGIEFSELLRGFIFLVEHPGWASWHFLGTSSIVQISLVHYMARKLVEAGRTDVKRLTFDSTTPTQFGKSCRLLHPIIPLEVIQPRHFETEFLKSMGVTWDGSPSSCIFSNVCSLTKYSATLGGISASACVAEFVEVLLSNRQKWKWDLGKRIIDMAFERGAADAVKLIPPELDRVKGLQKKNSILQLGNK